MKNVLSRMPCLVLCCYALLSMAVGTAVAREIPKPLPHHPGNIFLEGEDVVVPLPDKTAGIWKLYNYEDQILAEIRPRGDKAICGRLPIGFYRLRPDGRQTNEWVSVGVLAGLKSPTPASSPIGADTAAAWFYAPEKIPDVASICALAGLNWVRDRLSWAEMEPEKGKLIAESRYDKSARAMHGAGLRVLQVNHISPRWANARQRRFPEDLRDAYEFYKAMAARWRGLVDAFEPWNEADIVQFGGHTGAEIAALQKAAYLGLKAGHHGVIGCQNVFATRRPDQLRDFFENDPWPYFDTFNLHHYDPLDRYPELYSEFRAVSAGRPLWVTEFSIPVKWSGDEKLKELADADLREQSERLVKSFAASLYEGVEAAFYFILGHYVEGRTQFGIIRPDLTPRPAFLSLAAVGRLLADAKAAGRIQTTDENMRAYLFRAKPDGKERLVLVGWVNQGEGVLSLPAKPLVVFDHIGREQKIPSGELKLGKAPVFAIFDIATAFAVKPPPSPQPFLPARQPSGVVLQPLIPWEKMALERSAYRISSQQEETLEIAVYAFEPWPLNSQKAPASVNIKVHAPPGWVVKAPSACSFQTGTRQKLQIVVDCRQGKAGLVETLKIATDSGEVLSLRLMPSPPRFSITNSVLLKGAARPENWNVQVSGNGQYNLQPEQDGVMIEAAPTGADKWVYPRYRIGDGERPKASHVGLAFNLLWLEGDGQFRGMFEEENGATYVGDLIVAPEKGKQVATAVLFENARFGSGWSPPDSNKQLDLPSIRAVKIGANTKDAKLKFRVTDLRWVSW